MNEKRLQEILKHIVNDKDNGVSLLENLSLSEGIYVINKVVKSSLKKAEEVGNFNDTNYFNGVLAKFKPVILNKVLNSPKLWIVYCESTGYPYEIDKDLIMLLDFGSQKDLINRLAGSGFKVDVVEMNQEDFKNEISHMYRNGYKAIRLMDDLYEPYIIEREDLYSHDVFFNEEYITNPDLQMSMISFFQEFRKGADYSFRVDLLKAREDKMLQAMKHAEFMVPCIKTETEDEVEISHPFFDLSENIESQDGNPVIAIPVFTDGFELDKCYQDNHETMLYSIRDLENLIEELGANGIIINALGISYYLPIEKFKTI